MSTEPVRDPSQLRYGLALIARQLRASPRGFVIGGVSSVVFAAMTVVSSLVIGQVTDRVLLNPDQATGSRAAWLAGAIVFGVALCKAGGVVGRRWGAYISQYGLQAGDRRRITRRFLSLGLPWHRRHATGTLLSNATSDVEAAAQVAAPLPMALGAAVLLLITAVLLLVTDLYLALVGFVVGPLIGLVNYTFSRKMRTASRQAQSTRGDVAEVAHESFDAALVVKTLGRERAEIARFDDETGRLRDHLIALGRLRGVFDPMVQSLPNLGILAVLVVGAWRIEQGALTAGALVTFSYLFRLVAMPMRVFGWLLGMLPQAVVGFDRVNRVLTADEDVRHGTTTLDGGAAATLDADGVGFIHPATTRDDLDDLLSTHHDDPAPTHADAVDVPIVHRGHHRRGVADVDLHLRPGTTLALVGATGSGKTTLASLVVRLFDPDTGRVRLDGVALPDLARDQLADHAVLVFQEAFLFDDTIRENITLGDDLTDEVVHAAARLAQAHDFITTLPDGYDTMVGERGASLSGGQRQRVALARALVRAPRLLVLDDATSAVDPSVEQAILTGLVDADLDTTVVVIAYRRGSIALADEVAFVVDGTIVDRGPHTTLMARNRDYSALVAAYDEDRRDRAGVGAGPDTTGRSPDEDVA